MLQMLIKIVLKLVLHIGDNQGAIEDYNQAIKINPHYGNSHQNHRIARYFLGNQQGFTQAIKINPHDADAYKNRGNARSELGDYAGAIEDYTQAIQLILIMLMLITTVVMLVLI